MTLLNSIFPKISKERSTSATLFFLEPISRGNRCPSNYPTSEEKRRELLSRNRVACINFMRYLYWIFLENEQYFLPLCRIPRAIHQRLAATKRFRFYSSRRGFPIRRPMQTSTTTFTMSSVTIDV